MTNFTSRFFFFPLLILAIVLHFSVFGDSPHNPYGIKGLNEAYLAVCIIFTILLLLASAEDAPREFRILMYYCLYSTVVFLLMPAVFAYFTYGQPIVFGLIEERRVLFCLGFAPLLFLGKRVSTLQFERALLYAALAAAFFSWCFKFGVIPDMRPEVRSDDRPDRSSIGPYLLCLGYFYCIQIWSKGVSPINGAARSKTFYLVIAALLLLTLVFATQTRQLIVLCLAFTLFCLRAKAVIWAASLAILLSPFYFYPSLLEILGLNIEFYDSSLESVEDGARSHTIAAIFAHLDQVNWLPSGSLSLMWQDGFIPYFGEHFFLSDVGIIGTLFRFGFLTFLIVPMTLFVYHRIAKNIASDMTFIYATMLAFFVIWPLNGFFEYGQPVFALLFVIHALRARHLRSQERIHERRAYPQLQGSY
ncbi:hypothetical protein A3710_16905 [Stutzerimonas frequens]|uniref:hypothetical protein n=1 Tax=Stutzerimonas frequens TaxID=2968969 RepID=UPI0007B9E3E0|nr:hypothetical protein [Stutzerimonas frequens]KZX63438.1 hypothetical protein A3710_16905 [Stutzerimonas frequens]